MHLQFSLYQKGMYDISLPFFKCILGAYPQEEHVTSSFEHIHVTHWNRVVGSVFDIVMCCDTCQFLKTCKITNIFQVPMLTA
jgi:hypothetical protein